MAQNYSYPSSSNVTLTGSTNGTPIPNNSIVVGGENSLGNTEPLQLDATNNLKVTLAAQSLTDLAVNLDKVGGTAITLGQKLMASSLPVVISSDQSTLNVSAAQSGVWNITNITGTVSLPTGASTSALQTQISGQLPATLGAHLTAASLSVNIASDQVVPVSATALPLPTGAATAALQSSVQGSATGGTAATSSSLSGGIYEAVLPTLTTGQQAAIQLDASGRQIISPLTNTSVVKAQLEDNAGTAITLGQKVAASSLPVVIASDQSAITVVQSTAANLNATVTGTVNAVIPASSTSSVTSVAGSATSVSLLAANASRKAATFYNDSTAILYLKLGATASTTSYTVQIISGGYYELPTASTYTGAIDGIWASATGAVRITELT